jgi:hypothetical protein
MQLKHHGILTSKRGRFGGYDLLLPAEGITFGHILRIIDGPIAPLACLSRTAYRRCSDCRSEESCKVRRVFARVAEESRSKPQLPMPWPKYAAIMRLSRLWFRLHYPDQAHVERRIKASNGSERFGLITAPYSYAVYPDPTTPSNVGMSVGVSNHCAMWSNAPGRIYTPPTNHGIGVSPVERHSCQECRGSECCKHDSAHIWHPPELR